MKEIRIEKINYTYEYEALDGVIFKSKEECEKYEESAKMVAYSKYLPLVISRKSEFAIYDVGSEEYEIDIIKINELEDIDSILQLYSLYHPYRDEKDILQERDKLNKWFGDGEIVFIGRGCNYDSYDCFELLGTMNGIIDHIKEACSEEEF